jgi:hypothetical protein
MQHLIIVWISLFLLTNPSRAQRFPDRWFTLNPLMDTRYPVSEGEWSWMHSSAGWGEFGAYRLVRDGEHAWVQRLGAFIELFRVGNTTSLAFMSDIEFIANPDNDIRFNPRAVFWQEGFLYTQRTGSSYWQVGYFHRCKHDVDNLILKRERSLIFGSLQAKYLLPFTIDDGATNALAVFRADLYTIRQDDRIPANFSTQTPHVKRMLGTAGAVVHLRRSLSVRPLGLYATYWGMVNFYGIREGVLPRFDGIAQSTVQSGAAAGLAIEGNAHFRIGFTYEYLSDTGLNPYPEHAHLVTLGIAIVNPAALW